MGGASQRNLPLFALLSANLVSPFGNQLTAIAVPWFVLQTTGSATKTGIAAFFTAVPALLAAFFGGPLVDRWGAKHAAVAADLASGLAVVAIPLLHQTIGLAYWQLLTLVFLGSLLDSPGAAARDSLLPDVAAAAGMPLERVNVVSQTLWRIGGLLGPPCAGLLIATFGATAVLALDAATFGISASLIAWAVPISTAQNAARAPIPVSAYLAELRVGWRFLQRDRLLLTIVLSFTALNALSEPLFSVILPVYARHLVGGALDLGLIIAAFAGGGLAATVLFGIVGQRLSRRTMYVGAFFAAAATMVPLIVLPATALVAGSLALFGFVSAPLNVLAITVTQERVPSDMRGRIFGTGRACALAAYPLAAVAAGTLVELIDLRGIIAIIAIAQLSIACLLARSATLRTLERR